MSRPSDTHTLGDLSLQVSIAENKDVSLSISVRFAVFAQCVLVSVAASLALRRNLGLSCRIRVVLRIRIIRT